MQRVKMNDNVTVIYEGTLKNGEIFESSADTGPLSFQVGRNEVLAAFEEGILNLAEGETKTITVPPEEAYGEKKPELIQNLGRDLFGSNMELKPGMVLGVMVKKDDQEHQVPTMVVEVEGDRVTVDFNHPLAGETLNYKVTVQSIDPPSQNQES